MFLVKPNTVELLFNAQKEELRGRLRLDISSRCFPADPTNPLPDLRRAREALGERFLRLLKSCAVYTASLGRGEDHYLLIMSSANDFEAVVQTRLQETFGLNQDSPDYLLAIRSLASDFTEWVRNAESEARKLGVVVKSGGNEWTAYIHCKKPPQEDFTALAEGRSIS